LPFGGEAVPVACVVIQHFPFLTEAQRHPELREQPVVLAKSLGSKSEVVDFSPSLRGLTVGMPLQEALGMASGVRIVEADIPYYRNTFQGILTALQRHSPRVEHAGLGHAYLDMDGLSELYGSDARFALAVASTVPPDFGPRVGLGNTKFAAYLAANVAKPKSAFKAPDGTARFAQLFAVEYLPVPAFLHQRLRLFGLNTLKDVAEIGVGPMQAQFGPAGKLMWELSNGIDERPIVPIKEREEIAERFTLPYESASLEMLLFGIDRLLRRAFARPEMQGKYAGHAVLECSQVDGPPWSRAFAFKEALGDADRVLFAIRSRLEMELPKATFDGVAVILGGLRGEPSAQTGLIRDVKDTNLAKLTEVDQGLRTRGIGGLYKIVELDPRHPIPEMRAIQVPLDSQAVEATRPLKMPVPIQVEGSLPGALRIGATKVGPAQIQDMWKVNLWWLQTPIERLYLEVTEEDGVTMTMFQDQRSGQWYQQVY